MHLVFPELYVSASRGRRYRLPPVPDRAGRGAHARFGRIGAGNDQHPAAAGGILRSNGRCDPYKVCTNYTAYTGQTKLNSGWYVVAGAVTNGTRIAIDRLEGNAEVNLILCDGAERVANGGIEVTRAPDHHLVIWAQSDGPDAGKLTATAGDDSAGIGGTHDDNYSATEGLKYVPGGTVTINGGAITATGGGEGAGIGGGKGNACVWVTVNGGTVEALGGVSGGRAIDNGGSSSSNPTRMSLYARAKVTAGDDASSANPVAATNRVDACQSKSYAKIEPCGPHKYDNGICTWCGDIACTVTNVTAVQMSPTSGKVDITFDVVSGAVG